MPEDRNMYHALTNLIKFAMADGNAYETERFVVDE
jgi:hypothetical protein